MKISPAFLAKIFFGLFLGTCLFQVHSLIYIDSAYSSGHFSLFTANVLYLSDVFLILSLIFFSFDFYKNKKVFEWGPAWLTGGLLLLGISFLLPVLWAKDAILVVGQIGHFLLFLGAYFLIINRVLDRTNIIQILLAAGLFQVFIAMGQVVWQVPLGLHFWGEPHFSEETLGIAKTTIGGVSGVRAYGTLAHPNVLAGILVVIFLLIGLVPTQKKALLIRGLLLLGILLTFSRLAFVALLITIIFYVLFLKNTASSWTKIVFKIALLIIFINLILLFLPGEWWQTETVQLRFLYNKIAVRMFWAHPLGVGGQNFILNMSEFTQIRLLPWEFQPVHNVFLLVFSESGILAGVIFILWLGGIFRLFWQKRAQRELQLLWMILIGLVFCLWQGDHYFWTIYAGQAIWWTYLGIVGQTLLVETAPE